jgi:hypothetical protein
MCQAALPHMLEGGADRQRRIERGFDGPAPTRRVLRIKGGVVNLTRLSVDTSGGVRA